MLAKDLMTTNVLVVCEEWSVDELAQTLSDRSISGAPVVSSAGALVGVVSLTDIVRSTSELKVAWGMEAGEHAVDPGLSPDDLQNLTVSLPSGITVQDIMTPMVFEVDAQATAAEVASTMLRGRIHRVFVVKAGKVTGVISALDVLKAFTAA